MSSSLRLVVTVRGYGVEETAAFERHVTEPAAVYFPHGGVSLQAASRLAPLLHRPTEMRALHEYRGEGKELKSVKSAPFSRAELDACLADEAHFASALDKIFGGELMPRHMREEADVLELIPSLDYKFETESNRVRTYKFTLTLIDDELNSCVGDPFEWHVFRTTLYKRTPSRDATYAKYIHKGPFVIMYEPESVMVGEKTIGECRDIVASWKKFSVCLHPLLVAHTLLKMISSS